MSKWHKSSFGTHFVYFIVESRRESGGGKNDMKTMKNKQNV